MEATAVPHQLFSALTPETSSFFNVSPVPRNLFSLTMTEATPLPILNPLEPQLLNVFPETVTVVIVEEFVGITKFGTKAISLPLEPLTVLLLNTRLVRSESSLVHSTLVLLVGVLSVMVL